jgi:hypothetical protein
MHSPATDASVEAAYAARLDQWRAERDAHERTDRLLSRIRISLVAVAILLIVILRFDAGLWLLGVGVAFGAAVVRHARVIAARDRARRAVAWYEQGQRRLRHEWLGHGDQGDRFRPAHHLYADDIDIFGHASLFQLLSTARTRGGQETLASWLLQPAPPELVRARQAAVRELAARLPLRESMGIEGDGFHVEAVALRDWATAPPILPSRHLAWPLAALSATNITLLLWYLATNDLGLPSLAVMTLQGIVVLWLHRRASRIIREVETPARDLAVVASLLRVLERESFEAPALQALSAAIGRNERAASAEIAHLERLVDRLSWRRDMIFGLPAALMLWGTQCALAIDGWRRRTGHRVPAWLDAVGAFEAFAALATFAAEHPSYTFPAIDAAPAARLSATALAHPLLPASAVANDIAIGGDAPALLVVSGSNMSGKSTFLRAIGVNLVLAQAGAPVRATTFTATPLDVCASIQIVDSLAEGQSRFFAEITRLKSIVDHAKAHPAAMLFLLDEILSGTNSHDRALGAEALLRGLLREGAVGLVTTHDLALSRIAEAMAPVSANVHFADAFDAGGLQFDYRLRPGPVRTSNALALMRSIGLDV